MIDRLTRRSAYVSTAVHAALVAAAFIGANAVAKPEPEPPTSEAAKPPPPPAEQKPGILVIAPEALAAAAAAAGEPPPLPSLKPEQQPDAKPLVPIVPRPTGGAGESLSRGDGGKGVAAAQLPSSSSAVPGLIDELRARADLPRQTREEDLRSTAGNYLEMQLHRIFAGQVRAISARVARHQILVRITTDAAGSVVAVRLDDRYGTGDEDLDRAIANFLAKLDSFPRLDPSRTQTFLVKLP